MRTLLLSFILLFTINGYSQKINVITATSQNWSGGLAGHHGINYHFVLQCTDTNIVPDTVWIGGGYYPISEDKNDTITRKVDRRHNTVTYNIYEGEAYNDMESDPMRFAAEQNAAKIKQPTPRQYNGAALISYTLKGKQYNILVKAFSQLTPLNYP